MTSIRAFRLRQLVRLLRASVPRGAGVMALALFGACLACAQSVSVPEEGSFDRSLPQLQLLRVLPAFTSAGESMQARFSNAGSAKPGFNGGSSTQTSNAPDFSKWGIALGSGVDVPAGGQSKTYHSESVGFQFALGRNLTRSFGAQLEYDLDFLGIPRSVLSTYCSNCTSADAIINSVTLNPNLRLNPTGRMGAYLIGGAGYYLKKTRFLNWTGEEVCYPTEGCVPEQSVVASWSSNAFGWNWGGGVTWRIGGSSVKVFAEGRYVWINNKASSNANADYPPAYYRTTFVPAVVGIRW